MIGREKDPSNSEVARLIQQSLEQDRLRAELEEIRRQPAWHPSPTEDDVDSDQDIFRTSGVSCDFLFPINVMGLDCIEDLTTFDLWLLLTCLIGGL